MKFKKYLSLVFISALLLSACGAKPAEKKESSSTAASKAEETKSEPKVEEKEENKEEEKENKKLEKLTLVLDWVPNTNHTGLFVAQDKGYFEEEGLELDIVQPAEDSSASIVGAGKAEFGISFQPNMVKRILKEVPVTAVAAIVQHNTGGIMTLKDAGINSPKDITEKKHSTWEDPIDDATIQEMVEKDGGDWSKVVLIPGESTDATTALQTKIFDSIFVFQGWDYIHSQIKKVDTNFFLLKDFVKEFDYYTPVLIANNDFLSSKPDLAKKALKAIKKGYEFAAKKPDEAADILIKNAPEGDAELMRESQKFLSTKYIDDAASWGIIDKNRWNAFYQWLYEKKLVEKDITDKGFTNAYLE